MAKTITGVLVEQNEGKNRARRYLHDNGSYKNLYPLLKCTTFACVSRKIGQTYYDIWCDDEGLFDPSKTPTVLTFDGNELVEQIVGNCFICKRDWDDMGSLTDEEVREVLASIKEFTFTGRDGKFDNRCVVASI